MVGFKLTCGKNTKPMVENFVDIIVHNKYEDIKDNYRADIYTKNKVKSVNSKEELALELDNMIKEFLA